MTRIFKPDSGQTLEIQDEGGSAALTIDTYGSVGIARTPPADMFLSYSNIAFGGNSTMQTNNSTGPSASLYISQNAYRDNDPNWRRISDSDEASQYWQNNGTHKFQYVASGSGDISWTTAMTIDTSGDVTISGALSKGSGSFKIDHPLESKSETHNLVHSFIEGPQADLIYRGKVTLIDGEATVNIDTVSNMTEGTFVILNTNIQCFTNNETSWGAVKGSLSGNILTITAQDTSTDTISWMVIGERQDLHMIETDWTDDNGKVIVEPEKVIVEPENA